ncbi:glutaredoxin [Tulasnella sp. JGI-2019a]|nr:glutaredoxin [Tulasnella sp. JGI-2019a]KAG9013212.1 glutaredoxin [Tulasnella sp. JGI-2019a]
MASLLLRRAVLGSTINSTRALVRRPPPSVRTAPPASIAFFSLFTALGSSTSTESSSDPSLFQLNQMTAKETVESAISGNKVVLFSKSYCPYCKKAKATLAEQLGDEYKTSVKVYEIDEVDGGSDIQAYLLEKSGQRTVPNIYINETHVGGNDDLQKAKSDGKLAKLLAASTATSRL